MLATMRTTLDLEPDVLQAAKEIAEAKGITTGQAVSELVRRALSSPPRTSVRNGVPVLRRAPGEGPLTMQAVNRLRDE
jgi:predicted DNA-binding ribbon-helix-helix protein